MTQVKYELYGVRHCYIEYNNAGVLAFKRVYMTNKTDVKVSNTKLAYSGDGTKYDKNYGYQASGTVEAETDDDTLDSILFNTPVVNPGGGDDFAKRYIKGTDAELQTNFVGVRITLDGADADLGTPIVCRYRILKVQFAPDAPPAMASSQKQGRMLVWDGRRALTDVVGVTPTGMPSRGCFWLKDWITVANNFDPVPGDIL